MMFFVKIINLKKKWKCYNFCIWFFVRFAIWPKKLKACLKKLYCLFFCLHLTAAEVTESNYGTKFCIRGYFWCYSSSTAHIRGRMKRCRRIKGNKGLQLYSVQGNFFLFCALKKKRLIYYFNKKLLFTKAMTQKYQIIIFTINNWTSD